MAGISGVGGCASASALTSTYGAGRAAARGQQVREAVHQARDSFRAEGGARNQGQAIRAAIQALRNPETQATDADGDEIPGVVDAGNDPATGETDAPLNTTGTLDVFA